MQEWSSDTLWAKAKQFSDQAFEVDPRSSLFPLLASFALEALGKSALAKIHPALIADPRGEGQNILYAFGVPTKDPRTIVAKTIFTRLVSLVDAFTSDDADVCQLMAERRNRELHTGEMAYEEYNSGSWLHDYYRVTAILTEFMGRNLDEFLGTARAIEARETNVQEDKRITSTINKLMAECRRSIEALKAPELLARRSENEPKTSWAFLGAGMWIKTNDCPSCRSKARLFVKHIGDRPAEIVDALIYVESIYSPRKFECGVCELTLTGTPELRVAGMADQIFDTAESEPTEYFEIETYDPHDDYGNE